LFHLVDEKEIVTAIVSSREIAAAAKQKDCIQTLVHAAKNCFIQTCLFQPLLKTHFL